MFAREAHAEDTTTLAMLFQITEIASDQPVLTGATIEDTAAFVQLNAEEIEWAIEECGVCETDVHRIEAITDAEVEATGDSRRERFSVDRAGQPAV